MDSGLYKARSIAIRFRIHGEGHEPITLEPGFRRGAEADIPSGPSHWTLLIPEHGIEDGPADSVSRAA